MNHDAPTTPDLLDRLRPEPSPLDEQWSRATLDSILASPSIPSVGTPRTRRVPRVRTVVVGAVGVGLLGTGVAAATGLTQTSFTDTFSGWGSVSPESEPGRQAVDPTTAERVATAAGPGSTVFSIVAAPGEGGFACVAVLFETTTSASAPQPNDFVDGNGSSCAAVPAAGAEFGDMLAGDVQRLPGALGEPDVRVFSLDAGDATRAVVTTAAGGDVEALLYGGRFYGWYAGLGDDRSDAVLVGYDADGDEVGRVRP